LKVLINRKPIYDKPWGGGNNFVKAFVRYGKERGHKVIHTFEENIDCIFIQDPRPSELGISALEIIDYKKKNPNTIIAHRVNECDARKGTFDMDQMLRYWSQGTDVTFFVSEWIQRYFGMIRWGCENQHVLYNGVDKNMFKPNDKLGNGKVNIVTHHWSNNEMKGFDIYEKIDEFVSKAPGFTFTYIGRDRGTLPNTKIVAPLFGDELGSELGKYDIYVSASRFDPGPNHILESLACGIPTYAYIDGGGCLEMVGDKHVYSSFEELMSFILGGGIGENTQFGLSSWKECMEQCFSTIEDLVGKQ
jgi:glycosyltransferase involved in cell wall biosynthesis